MQRLLTYAFCSLLVLIALAGPATAKRVALVIGNADYRHAASLRNPGNDANAVSAVLRKLGFTVLKGFDLDRLQLEAKIRDFARAMRGADTALFFYAGHGLQVKGRNYLAPVDAKLGDEADLEFEAVRLENVMAQMEREPRTNLVFLDACRDNPLARNLARSMGTRSAAIGRGLARVETGVGTLIAFATQPGNVALDGRGRHSPFTKALLKHIERPGMELEALMRHVRVDVMASTGNRQVPWSSSSLIGTFSFVKGTPPASPDVSDEVLALRKELEALRQKVQEQKPQNTRPSSHRPSTVNETREEYVAWSLAMAEGTASAYRDYLNRYPNGAHAAEIRRLLRMPAASARPATSRGSSGEYLAWSQAIAANTVSAYQNYLANYPNGAHVDDVRRRLRRGGLKSFTAARSSDDEFLAWSNALAQDSRSAYRAFLRDFPNGQYAADIRQRLRKRR